MSNSPTFSEVIRSHISAAAADTYVALPGRVTSYDLSKLSASVQPLVKKGYRDEEDARQTEELPVIPDVPVVFPGAGSFRITFPVTVGDTGLLVFCSASLDRWKSKGGMTDPGDDRRQHLTDAVFVPGLRDLRSPTAAAAAAMSLEGADIWVGGTGAVPTILGPAYNAALTTFLTAFAAWVTATQVALISIPTFVDPAKSTYATATTTFTGAVTAFTSSLAGLLSLIAKVK